MNSVFDAQSRRDMLKNTVVVAGAALSSSLVATNSHAEPQHINLRRGSKFLIDCHVHVGGSPVLASYTDQIHSTRDWVVLRSTMPEKFSDLASQKQIDNSDDLVARMNEYGVTHAIVQITPGRDASNRRLVEAAKKHEGRLFPVFRPESFTGALGAGDLMATRDDGWYRQNSERIAKEIESAHRELGMIGVGELVCGGVVTNSIDPVQISRDMAPIMETLSANNLPLQIPTGSSAWKGGLHYIYDPLWVDELAGNFPKVRIILTKMGRGYQSSFDACSVVAMRNSNVFFDLTDSRSDHLRQAIQRIGARRIMFGTDLHGISINFAYREGLNIIEGASLSAEEWEWIAWRSANEIYKLGLPA